MVNRAQNFYNRIELERASLHPRAARYTILAVITKDMGMSDEWLTTKQAAKLIGYHPEYVRQLVKAGKIEAKKIGRDWLIEKSRLLAYRRKTGRAGAKRGPKPAH